MSGLQIETTQNPHTQAVSKPSTNPHGFGDIKAYLQQHSIYQLGELIIIKRCSLA